MKKGEVGEFSAKWWKGSQPKGLASAGRLELALKAYEVARAGLEKNPADEQLEAALDSLGNVEDVAGKVEAEAARAKGDPEMGFTAQALGKLDFAKERRSLEALAGDEEAGLADPEAYKGLLRKGLRRLAGTQMNWAFVMGKKPIEHRLLLHPSKNGRGLGAKAAQELGLTRFTFGTAIAAEDRDATILLTVEGKQLPGLAKRAARMLKAFKPVPYQDVVLFVEGKEVQDIADEEEDQEEAETGPTTTGSDPAEAIAALRKQLNALAPRAAVVMNNLPDRKPQLSGAIQKLMAALEQKDVAAATPMLAKLEEAVTLLEGVSLSAARGKQAAEEIARSLPGKVKSAVGYAKLRLQLSAALNARAAAVSNLEAACDALLDLDTFIDDPDLEQMRAAVANVGQKVPPMDDLASLIQDALDDLTNATTPEQRQRLVQPALKAMDDYMAQLDQDDMLRELQSTEAGSFAIYDQIAKAVTGLRQALAA